MKALEEVERKAVSNTPIRSSTILDREPIAANCYASANDLATALECGQRGEAITARAVGKVKRINEWIGRDKAVTTLKLSTYLTLCFGIIMSIKAHGDVRITRDRPETWREWGDFL
jgi:hypothetical protein